MFLPLLGGIARGGLSIGSRIAGGGFGLGMAGGSELGGLGSILSNRIGQRGISDVARRAGANTRAGVLPVPRAGSRVNPNNPSNWLDRIGEMMGRTGGASASTGLTDAVSGQPMNIVQALDRVGEWLEEPVYGDLSPADLMNPAMAAGGATATAAVYMLSGPVKRGHPDTDMPMLEDAGPGDARRKYFRAKYANLKRKNQAAQLAQIHDDRTGAEEIDESNSTMIEENGVLYLPGPIGPHRIIRGIKKSTPFEWLTV